MGLGNIPSLQAQIAALERQIQQIKQSGEVVTGVRIETYSPGGSASVGSKVRLYQRLRAVGRGARLDDGSTTRAVSGDVLGHYQMAIARGREVIKLERKLSRFREELARLEQMARDLGLDVPVYSPESLIF